jgi:transposase
MREVSDGLWEAVGPLLPAHEPDPRGGRPRVHDRMCFGAIVFVLVTGIAWRQLPRSWGFRRRLRTGG